VQTSSIYGNNFLCYNTLYFIVIVIVILIFIVTERPAVGKFV